MGKTITIPRSRFRDYQTDDVRTGCCMILQFAKSGWFDSPLAVELTAEKLSRIHVDARPFGPIKTPRHHTSYTWHFDSDDGTIKLDGTLNVDPNFDCADLVISHICRDDDFQIVDEG